MFTLLQWSYSEAGGDQEDGGYHEEEVWSSLEAVTGHEGSKHVFGPHLQRPEQSRSTDKFHAEWKRRLFKGNSPEGLKLSKTKQMKKSCNIRERITSSQDLLSENIKRQKQWSTTREPCEKREKVKHGGAGKRVQADDRAARHASKRSPFLAQSLIACVSASTRPSWTGNNTTEKLIRGRQHYLR